MQFEHSWYARLAEPGFVMAKRRGVGGCETGCSRPATGSLACARLTQTNQYPSLTGSGARRPLPQ